MAFGGEPVVVGGCGGTHSALLGWLGEFDQPLTSIAAETDGLYALIRFAGSGEGEIVNDGFGVHTIYTGETETTRLFSNRPELVAEAMEAERGRSVEADADALAMVALLGFVAGDATTYRGVSTVPFGCGVRVDRDLAVSLEKSRPDPWDVEAGNPTQVLGDLDALEDRMVRFVRSVVDSRPGRPSAELTAGRDSRLVLAVLAQAGMLDGVTFFTRGDEVGPDFRGAATIADRLGLDFVRARWPVAPGSYLDFYEQHVARVSGSLGCWESSEPRGHEGPRFSGLFGEVLRAAFPRMAASSDGKKLRKAFGARLRDGAGPMKASVVERTTEHVLDLLFEPLAEGYPVETLSDIFYVQHQMRRFMGAQMERHTHHFYPLYVDGASRAAFRMGPRGRLDDSLRKGLMERAAVALDDVDFQKADRAKVPSGEEAARSGRYRTVDVDRASGSPPRPIRKPPPRVDALVSIACETLDSAAFDIVDRDAFVAMVEDYDELTRLERMALHRCLTPILFVR